MTTGWQWFTATATPGRVRVGVTTSRREHTTSTVITAGFAGQVNAGFAGQVNAGFAGHQDAGPAGHEEAGPAGHEEAGPAGHEEAGSAGHEAADRAYPFTTALLVDPSWDPDELAWIGTSLATAGISVTAGFSTHAHHDHLLWHPGLPQVPRWASETTAREAQAKREALIVALGPDWSGQLAAQVGAVIDTPGPDLRWAGTPITMVTHNAHSPGHTALWVPAARVLVAGDMLSDVELPLLEESSLADYLDALDALRPLVNQAEVIIPGHGTPATGPQGAARWAADHRYLEAMAGGADPGDPRRDLPGMEHAHRANLERLAAVT